MSSRYRGVLCWCAFAVGLLLLALGISTGLVARVMATQGQQGVAGVAVIAAAAVLLSLPALWAPFSMRWARRLAVVFLCALGGLALWMAVFERASLQLSPSFVAAAIAIALLLPLRVAWAWRKGRSQADGDGAG